MGVYTLRPRKTLSQKFETKYIPEPNSGCWLWTGGYTSRGYGQIGHDGAWILAHRASYILHCDAIPDGHVVCHKCDNPACVNPDHLFLGTQKDNMRDKFEKGRDNTTKLSNEQVLEIHESHKTYRDLAEEFNTHLGIISKIKNGTGYTHVTGGKRGLISNRRDTVERKRARTRPEKKSNLLRQRVEEGPIWYKGSWQDYYQNGE